MIVEAIAGWLTHSLALLADAGHMLSDVASQALAIFAIWFATRPPTPGKSYGYYRTEILAGLINSVALVGISIWIIAEAVRRLSQPPSVDGSGMMIVAIIALAVNLISTVTLHSVASTSVNLKAAYLELVGDLLASVGVLAAALLINFTHFYLADPAISLLIGFLILPRTWMLICECTNILMEGAPSHIDVDALKTALLSVEGVLDVHDIHVWTITSGLDAMSAHVCIGAELPSQTVLSAVTQIAQDRFGIRHTTIQIEKSEAAAS
jgi:cobalt-zinc-cadmium efflux system protein